MLRTFLPHCLPVYKNPSYIVSWANILPPPASLLAVSSIMPIFFFLFMKICDGSMKKMFLASNALHYVSVLVKLEKAEDAICSP